MLTKAGQKTTYGINEAKDEMKAGIEAYFITDEKGRYIYDPVSRLPYYLFGAPGIGKTQITKQVADELGIGFVSFSVTHHTRNSIIGLPVISDLGSGEKYTQYSMSEVIAAVIREKEKGYDKGILLLDEFNCASDTIMPVMLAFLQTRNIGLYKLPDDWVIVLCGNPVEYNSSAKNFSPAIMDRVRKIEIVPEDTDFFQYAEKQHFNRFVFDYLKLYPHNIYKVTNVRNGAETVTMRGWENLSRTIDAYDRAGFTLTPHTVQQFIKSDKIAADFWNYYWLNHNSFDDEQMHQIVSGKYGEDLIKIFDECDLQFVDGALEVIERELIRNAAYEKPKTMSAKISNVFGFFEKTRINTSVCEKFFLHITANDQLCDLVRRVKNDKYLETARRMYGLAG